MEAVATADVRAERARILSTLLDRIEAVIDRAVGTIWAEIPAYRGQTSASWPTCATRSARTTARSSRA